MPNGASMACPAPGCPNVQPCQAHARKPWRDRPSARARGYNGEYERNRARVLAEEDTCWICHTPGRADDQADHVQPLSRGGTSERDNLRRAHKACNQGRGAR